MVTAKIVLFLLLLYSDAGSQHESTNRNGLFIGHRFMECTPGYFGPDCKKQCVGCNDRGCDVTSGRCHYCKTGLYGTNCSHQCPVNCSSDQSDTGPPCERYSGKCTIGCKGNMCSPKCDQQCPSNCEPDTCNFANCECRCKGGFSGFKCACSSQNQSVSVGIRCFLIGISFSVPVVICLWHGFSEWKKSIGKYFQRLKRICTREGGSGVSSENNYDPEPGKYWFFLFVPVAVVVAAVWIPVGSYICFGSQ